MPNRNPYAKPLAKLTGPMVEVSCIGIGSLKKPHTFLTNNPTGNHVCPKCADKARTIRVHPMEERAYTTHLDG